MSELTAEESALAGLATLGTERYFRAPNIILDETGLGVTSDRSIELAVLEVLVAKGLAYSHPALNAYALTQAGLRKAREIVMHKIELAPLDALALLVHFTSGVSIQKGEQGVFVVQVRQGSTAYVATHADLGAAILEVKAQLDRVVLGG